jgi:hypothetical protein
LLVVSVSYGFAGSGIGDILLIILLILLPTGRLSI